MRYLSLLLLVFLFSLNSFAQTGIRGINSPIGGISGPATQQEGEKEEVEVLKAPITDYQIISVRGDTTYVDTTLTIQKEYKFNYLRKDNFGLLPFSNIGQTYTSLERKFERLHTMPEFGAKAAHFAFLEVEDIHYYRMPTPWTELMFKTTFEQGQLLDAFFTVNITPEFNLSIAHKGLHSLGKYRHLKTSQGSFRTTLSYQAPKGRYGFNTHFISQSLKAEQNGGLTEVANNQFASKSSAYKDRSILDVKYADAERWLFAKRFFFKQHYNVIKGDSTANNRVRVGHEMNFTDKEYYFDQSGVSPLYGPTFKNSQLADLTEFQEVSNTLSAHYQNNLLGKVEFRVRHSNYNYGYKRKLYLESGEVPNRLKGNIYTVGAAYAKKIGGFELSGDAMLNTVGDFDGNYLRAQAAYQLDSLNRVEAGISTTAHRPDYNFLLYQSDYKNYNWSNDFKNVQRQRLYFRLQSPKIAHVEAEYNRIHNHTYFGLRKNPDSESQADTLVTPYQYDGDVSYLKIKLSREFNFGKFALDNTLMYQEVLDGARVFRVSPFITRNTFYYQDHWFQRNLFLQMGLQFNYFHSYYADGYDPVMSEFYVQDRDRLTGFPRVDFFFNAKVRTARIYFKLENMTTLLDGNGRYAAPYEPYRDWVIRFGMVWDFFL